MVRDAGGMSERRISVGNQQKRDKDRSKRLGVGLRYDKLPGAVLWLSSPLDWLSLYILDAITSLSTATPYPTPVADALAMYDDNGNGRITCAEARVHLSWPRIRSNINRAEKLEQLKDILALANSRRTMKRTF